MTLEAHKTDEKLLTTIQQEYKILAEYKMIESEQIGGVYVIPSFGNSLLWYAVIFIRQGFYAGGIFRFTILLPDKFPDDKTSPTIIFQSDIFHPLVCPYTGTLDISAAFPHWRSGEDHVWQLLKYLQAIFVDTLECLHMVAGTEGTPQCNNVKAAELLRHNRAEFIAQVKECVSNSKDRIYEQSPTDDPHYITFEKFEQEVHGPTMEHIRLNKHSSNAANSTNSKGLSWVKEGEFTPLSLE
ncbi:protein crossbronx-like [Teleopsis dalmanni]|uniref:protein crossbronx-like n=1 Tax=Teleopsis dalmanni TaxID=139649 RepID=UPI0018CCF50D|nr:protein crossbronx-like [Teleopsis dalmanni]XP_037956109.1 protein crossbronx [Teleopsis dalmanni]XP_037958728.1 protein crossbronx-like [Teleopsis dalmanni]